MNNENGEYMNWVTPTSSTETEPDLGAQDSPKYLNNASASLNAELAESGIEIDPEPEADQWSWPKGDRARPEQTMYSDDQILEITKELESVGVSISQSDTFFRDGDSNFDAET